MVNQRSTPSRRTSSELPATRQEYLSTWSGLHSNIDPSSSVLVSTWLRLVYFLSAPLVRASVSAHVVTVAAVLAAAGSVALSRPGTSLPLLAAVLIVFSGLLDGIDGGVAMIGRSQSQWGYLLDTVSDRCSDLLFLAGSLALGAPMPIVVAVGVTTLLHETARARAVGAGISDVGFLTVWERPSRVVAAVVTATVAGAGPGSAQTSATIGISVTCGLAVLGFTQLMFGLYRRADRTRR
ncbi:CDP-alcohol phosphatidyltransferase family protein [Rhodococcus fascians]|nr:CDP-alcohol phosphatidyltransferase family protein [Rhodococcus fascians]MBY4240443.1 CDP-alcohol phosphatidyltransferase family protein [Rhodococcus fascians]MBY4256110.1 CDP-alcohol phosphatidyltransferase family protein [Rhodococcus fascians]MBY4271837.1 CDP-alcohol phosphatidyltransferase family protein [Rhodococcus fascians]